MLAASSEPSGEHSENHSGPAFADANGIRLCYETFGERSDPPIVLIMGLAAQMIVWDDDFCRELAARGRFVVRFDNRDIGLSTRFPEQHTPRMFEILVSQLARVKPKARYTLVDMARDTVGLMDALGLASAHIVGVSMGGAIAQEIAINFRSRIRTLTSIMSSTGDSNVPPPTLGAMGALLRRSQASKEAYLDQYVKTWRTLAGNHFPFDAERTRAQGANGFERGPNPAGVARQMMAIVASGNRKPQLRKLSIPTLIIHGTADPLMRFKAAPDLQATIPGAKLVAIEGMGHTLPRAAWPQILGPIEILTSLENGPSA
jgi:pimeloyl-ACP methyl ester carboxylesterase